jgi:hypothetical protein
VPNDVERPADRPDAERSLRELRFRSILDRTLEDQQVAAQRGYSSVERLAIDELGVLCHALIGRSERLEHAILALAGMSVLDRHDIERLERILAGSDDE